MTAALPIDPLLPAVVDALRAHPAVVLRAAPGAGKTTRVPPALLDAGLACGRQVVVLEPRRIAARAAAARVAHERGEAPGGSVGWRVRFDHRGGPHTRLWFVTEGVFGRCLGDDPFLEDVGVVVLDEFHERHLQGDLAFAVARALQRSVRPDLRLVIMSATLQTDALARVLPDAAVLAAEGRAHPVATTWLPLPQERHLAERVVQAVRTLLGAGDDGGDVLVFLPGAAEIRRSAEALAPLAAARAIDVLPLHGELPLDAQERALARGPRRRIVLATNVAETALTVEGVTAVVDTGLARVSRFDPRLGLDRLVLAPVSRASADQRAGRAGRTAPGRCVRLWGRDEHGGRRAFETPEILRLDLVRTVLELRAWGLDDLRALPWIDPPPAAALARAERLLGALGAIGADGTPTTVGRRMLALPAAPRLARMLVAADDEGCARTGALLAALAGERDVLTSARALGGPAVDRPPGPSDLLLRLELVEDAVRHGGGAEACRGLGLEPRAVHAVMRAARQLARDRPPDRDADPERLLRCLLAGFADRVARRRAPGSDRAVMVGGVGLVLARESVVREAELFVAVDVEAGGPRDRGEAKVRLASMVRHEWLPADALATERTLCFDVARDAVVERMRRRFHDLVLAEQVRTDVDRAAAGAILAAAVSDDPTLAARVAAPQAPVLARLRFLARAMPELGLPDDPAALRDAAVAACAAGRRSLAELADADLGRALLDRLDGRQRRALETEAPARYRLPSGRLAPVAYEPDRPPAVSARIQELFGLLDTPRLAAGRVPLLVELLAPNQRPVQITSDLRSFWRTTYAEVRRQLRGRYPKHAWPEDPLAAPPTARPGRPRPGGAS